MSSRKLISFDWAMKRLLRSKANFEILEGFFSELTREDITVLEILKSESNKEGRKEGRLYVAINLLDVLDAAIAEKTGFSLEEIKKLRKNNKKP